MRQSYALHLDQCQFLPSFRVLSPVGIEQRPDQPCGLAFAQLRGRRCPSAAELPDKMPVFILVQSELPSEAVYAPLLGICRG